MAEYIEREKVRKLMRKYGFRAEDMTINEFVEDVLPAADVAPVVHGEWLGRRGGFFDFAACSNCREKYPTGGEVPNYCPNCGARMDGADND